MIPFNTTTITIKRDAPGAPDDPYDAQPPRVEIATGIRAHISTSTGFEVVAGGSQEIVSFRMDCDPVSLTNLDIVIDETTEEEYEVTWARIRHGLGLDHVEAGLKQITGVISGPTATTRAPR